MASKQIRVSPAVYQFLDSSKLHPGESFDEVITRLLLTSGVTKVSSGEPSERVKKKLEKERKKELAKESENVPENLADQFPATSEETFGF